MTGYVHIVHITIYFTVMTYAGDGGHAIFIIIIISVISLTAIVVVVLIICCCCKGCPLYNYRCKKDYNPIVNGRMENSKAHFDGDHNHVTIRP